MEYSVKSSSSQYLTLFYTDKTLVNVGNIEGKQTLNKAKAKAVYDTEYDDK